MLPLVCQLFLQKKKSVASAILQSLLLKSKQNKTENRAKESKLPFGKILFEEN